MGSITLAQNATVGAGSAYVSIVNAQNTSIEYVNKTADAFGRFQFTGINATYSSSDLAGPGGPDDQAGYTSGKNYYRAYANYTFEPGVYGEGYSAPFGIDADHSGGVSLSIVIEAPVKNVRTGLAYSSIQAAIDDANTLDGDTIQVGSGTYSENVVVNKTVSLIGVETGSGQPTVDGHGGYAINITADHVSLRGFNATNGSVGIMAFGNHTSLAGNTANDNQAGILLASYYDDVSGNTANGNSYDGIFLAFSCNDTLSWNVAEGNKEGIYLDYDSYGNTMINNTANNNTLYGIYVNDSRDNAICGNTANNNSAGIYLFYTARDNVISGNTANGNANEGIFVFVFDACGNNTITGNTVNDNRAGICLYDGVYNNISGNTASNNTNDGIFLSHESFGNISGNTVDGNSEGIGLSSSCNQCNITLNTVKHNTKGIYIDSSAGNVLWSNQIGDNGVNANVTGGVNYWNSTVPLRYTYDGSILTNYTGNDWGDYNGTDANGDGIGDTPYVIGADNIDYYPMVSPATPDMRTFTLGLKRGWNLVSSPLVVEPPVNVSVFNGTNVTMAAKYNKTAGGFDIYRVGKTPAAFPFEASQGYFLYCNNDTAYTINGYSEPGQSTAIGQGWNLIGWTNMTPSNSMSLAAGLYDVTMLARYNTTTGSYDIYRTGKTPTPFGIVPGEGYFLYTTYANSQNLIMG